MWRKVPISRSTNSWSSYIFGKSLCINLEEKFPTLRFPMATYCFNLLEYLAIIMVPICITSGPSLEQHR